MNRVSEARWKKAQEWESSFWTDYQHQRCLRSMRRPLWKWPIRWAMIKAGLRDYNQMPIGDDSNHWWAQALRFAEFLPDKVGTLIEIGCGPHTNTRLVLALRDAGYAVCSDPLIRTYMTLPRSWLRYAVGRGIVCSDSHPGEELPYANGVFDVGIMTNVLDHVLDPNACLQELARVVKPGGLVFLGNDVKEDHGLDDDIGHPHHLTAEWLSAAVDGEYEPLLHEVLPPGQGRIREAGSGCWLFVGRKNA